MLRSVCDEDPIVQSQDVFNPIACIQRSLAQKQEQVWRNTEDFYALLEKMEANPAQSEEKESQSLSTKLIKLKDIGKWYTLGSRFKSCVEADLFHTESAFDNLDKTTGFNKCKASLHLNSALKSLLNQVDAILIEIQTDDELKSQFQKNMHFKEVYTAIKQEWEKLEAQLHKFISKLEQVKKEFAQSLSQPKPLATKELFVDTGVTSDVDDLEKLRGSPVTIGTFFAADSPSPGNWSGSRFFYDKLGLEEPATSVEHPRV